MVDLGIVGPGVLGSLVAEQYKDCNASSTIALVFRSEDAERRTRLDAISNWMKKYLANVGFLVIFARLENEGYIVTTSVEAGKSGLKAKNVVFCAPPTGNNHYAEDVARAVKEVRFECTKDYIF